MSNILPKQLETELLMIVRNHFRTLAKFTNTFEPLNVVVCETIQADLWTLHYFCQETLDKPTKAIYSQVSQSLRRIRSLLTIMNLDFNSVVFQYSELGNLWKCANSWCEKYADNYELSTSEVWNLIYPVVPDILQKLHYNIYQAIWWKTVPKMDFEILQRTEGIVIESSIFELSTTPNAMAVQFALDTVIT